MVDLLMMLVSVVAFGLNKIHEQIKMPSNSFCCFLFALQPPIHLYIPTYLHTYKLTPIRTSHLVDFLLLHTIRRSFLQILWQVQFLFDFCIFHSVTLVVHRIFYICSTKKKEKQETKHNFSIWNIHRYIYVPMYEWMCGCTISFVCVYVEKLVGGWMDGCVSELLNAISIWA